MPFLGPWVITDQLYLFPSGLHIIHSLDEVNFIQNLVFYIEAAYKTAVSTSFRMDLKSGFLMYWTTHFFSYGKPYNELIKKAPNKTIFTFFTKIFIPLLALSHVVERSRGSQYYAFISFQFHTSWCVLGNLRLNCSHFIILLF